MALVHRGFPRSNVPTACMGSWCLGRKGAVATLLDGGPEAFRDTLQRAAGSSGDIVLGSSTGAA